MKNIIKPALVCLALLGSSHAAQALELGYDFSRLDTVWQTIGVPDSKIYEEILGKYDLNRTVSVDSTKGTVTGTQCKPPRQCASGQKPGVGTAPPDASRAVEFDIVRVSKPAYVQSIYRRYGLLSLYIAKNLEFNGVTLSPDDKARLDRPTAATLAQTRTDLLRQQMGSAVVESYLLYLSQYYLAEDLGAKCQAIRNADSLYNNAFKKIDSTNDLLPEYLPLYQQYINLVNSVQKNADRLLACTVIPTTTRAETVNAIQNTVAEEVNKALAVKVAATITLLDGASTVLNCPDPTSDDFKKNLSEFQKLACLRRGVDAVTVDLESTFTLARNVKDMRANLDFIREAEPALRVRQDSLLKEAGLNSLYQPIAGQTPFPKLSDAKQVVAETANVQAANDVIKTQITNAIASLVSLSSQVVPNGVDGCTDAQNLFKTVVMGTDNTATQTFINRTESCLTNLNNILKTRIVPTLDDRMQEKLTQDVKSLSAEVRNYFDQNAIQIIDNLAN